MLLSLRLLVAACCILSTLRALSSLRSLARCARNTIVPHLHVLTRICAYPRAFARVFACICAHSCAYLRASARVCAYLRVLPHLRVLTRICAHLRVYLQVIERICTYLHVQKRSQNDLQNRPKTTPKFISKCSKKGSQNAPQNRPKTTPKSIPGGSQD